MLGGPGGNARTHRVRRLRPRPCNRVGTARNGRRCLDRDELYALRLAGRGGAGGGRCARRRVAVRGPPASLAMQIASPRAVARSTNRAHRVAMAARGPRRRFRLRPHAPRDSHAGALRAPKRVRPLRYRLRRRRRGQRRLLRRSLVTQTVLPRIPNLVAVAKSGTGPLGRTQSKKRNRQHCVTLHHTITCGMLP